MESLSPSPLGDKPNVKSSKLPYKLISPKSCSVARQVLVLSSTREHCTKLNTAALGVTHFCIYSGRSSIPSSRSSSISLAGHSQPHPHWLRAEGLTFCPGYKIRHGMKSSRKYPRVRRTRLQLQHSSTERTCNADVNEPDQGPSSQGRGKFCPPCMLEYVATPNPSLLLPPAFHQLSLHRNTAWLFLKQYSWPLQPELRCGSQSPFC